MQTVNFCGYAVSGELDLNRLAAALGINRRYRWEEPMLLNPVTFAPVVDRENESQQVYLYHFGGMVFVDCSAEVVGYFVAGLAKVSEVFRNDPQLRYRDDYALRFEADATVTITNDYAVLPEYDRHFIDIVAFVIAKSVALERIEEKVDRVLDDVEGLIRRLGEGRLDITDEKLARLASSILDFRYVSISSIMILDKPEITWDNPAADRLYQTLDPQFELQQRYQEIKHKSETLLDVTDVFTGLSHARRSARLEWIIIALIAFEILITLYEHFNR